MATCVWRGDAPTVAQVSTFTVVDTWATNDTATLTCGGNSVTFTVAGAQTVTAVVAGLVAAWNASTAPELAEITASDADPAVTLTCDTAGVQFTVTSSEVTAGDGTVGDQVDTTSPAGPNVYSVATNWSGGAVPVDNDDIIFEHSSVGVYYGLDQNTVTPTSITIKASYTGKIGLPRTNPAGYIEYRDTYLKLCDTADGGNTQVDIGQGQGAGSGRIKLDSNTGKITMNVYRTGTRAEVNVPCLLWKGQHDSSDIYINRGDLGVAIFGGETAKFQNFFMGYTASQATDANVRLGDGITHKATYQVTINGGVFESLSTLVDIEMLAGDVTVAGAAAVTTLSARGGTYRWNHAGGMTTMIIGDGATIDFRGDMRGKQGLTNAYIYGGTIIDPNGMLPQATTLECFHVKLHEVYQGPAHQDWDRAAK